MGTKSKLIIKRRFKKDIHLWMAYDGTWDLVGDQLCDKIKTILYAYTRKQLINMVETLNITDISEEPRCQSFNIVDFIWFIEGLTSYKNDDRTDIEYLYTLNFITETFTGTRGEDVRAIPFALLELGFKMTSI